MPTLFILLLVIVGASCLLPGAEKGISFLLKPDFSKVIDTTLYYDALRELRKEQPDDPFWEKLEQRYKDQNL